MEGGDPILRCDDLAVGYPGGPRVAAGLRLAVERGSYLGIVGPNGCGKSALIKTIVGIHKPRGGVLAWNARPRIGYVPQHDSIDPIYPFRALEVVLLALGTERPWAPTPSTALRARGLAALNQVGMGHRAAAGYSELSGGQRQRVLVARALALDPDVLVLDEPTSALDPGGSERLLDLIDRLRGERGLTIILVSHDLSLVARRATHLLALHEGRHVYGPIETALTSERLTELFGYPMTVFRSHGHVDVLPGAR